MAARFPSTVKNPFVHFIVCFGPFVGAECGARFSILRGLAPVAPVVPDLLFELWLISTFDLLSLIVCVCSSRLITVSLWVVTCYGRLTLSGSQLLFAWLVPEG